MVDRAEDLEVQEAGALVRLGCCSLVLTQVWVPPTGWVTCFSPEVWVRCMRFGPVSFCGSARRWMQPSAFHMILAKRRGLCVLVIDRERT